MNDLTATGSTMLADISSTQFCSFKPETKEDKVRLYNAINRPESRIADMINKEIAIVDVVMMEVDLQRNVKEDGTPFTMDEPPETRRAMRVILIDADGHNYAATSDGIYSSIKCMYNVFGTLHFDDPVVMRVKQVAVKRGNTLTLEMV